MERTYFYKKDGTAWWSNTVGPMYHVRLFSFGHWLCSFAYMMGIHLSFCRHLSTFCYLCFLNWRLILQTSFISYIKVYHFHWANQKLTDSSVRSKIVAKEKKNWSNCNWIFSIRVRPISLHQNIWIIFEVNQSNWSFQIAISFSLLNLTA